MTIPEKHFSDIEIKIALRLTQFEFIYLLQALNLDHLGQRVENNRFTYSEMVVMEICKILQAVIPGFNPCPFFRYDKIDYSDYLDKQYCLLWMDRYHDERTGIFRVLTPRCSDTVAENINLPEMYPQENISLLEEKIQRENIVIEEFTDSHIEETSYAVFTRIVFLDLAQIRDNLAKKT